MFFILFLLLIPVQCQIENCELTVNLSEGSQNGLDIILHNVTYTNQDYFTNSSGTFGCICRVSNCAQDCCGSGQTLQVSSDTLQCGPSKSQAYTNLKGVQLHNIIHVPSRNICTEQEVQITLNASQMSLELLERGDLLWEQYVYHYQNYCLSTVESHVIAVVCVVPDATFSGMLYSAGMIISMPFLLVTFLVYAILPDRNLHQMALMFYVLSLLLSYLLLVTINLKSGLAPPLCEILGYSTLYCFMVSFFWMNVICFDIWFTFSGCRGFVGSKRSSERKKLALYSLYAFGVPLLVVVIVLVLDTFLPDCSIYKPGIGNEKCFLADGWPNLWYFYGEAGILVITNIVFFALTAWKIRQVKKETEMLKHNDSKRHNYEKDKQKFNLYVKLLFAMGANWSMEVISWLVNWQTDGSYSAIWYVPDFFNAIYGVFIFFIFVFKKKIWLLLKRRYYNFVGKPHLANTLTSANTRTSHYSSTNYSTADTNISSASTGRARQEEVALRGMST